MLGTTDNSKYILKAVELIDPIYQLLTISDSEVHLKDTNNVTMWINRYMVHLNRCNLYLPFYLVGRNPTNGIAVNGRFYILENYTYIRLKNVQASV